MKREFKGSAMLNPVPLALITSKEQDTDKINVFTVGWIGTACQTKTQYSKMGVTLWIN